MNETHILTATPAPTTETSSKSLPQQSSEEVRDIAFYRKVLMPLIPKNHFDRNPVRAWIAIGLLLTNISLIATSVLFLESLLAKVGVGILLGFFNAFLAFISHELLHGSVIMGRNRQDFLALFTFLPFLMSPTFWRFWHNKLHHGNTQDVLHDPDCFPNNFIYKRSSFMQKAFKFTPGSKTIISYAYFFFWFSFQTIWNQISVRFKTNMWKQLDQKRVSFEFGFQVLMAAIFLALIGIENWLPLAVLPFLIQNYTLMSYISTNHNLSPLTKENDPLMNSLSVSNHPWLEKLHFNFGYHVEHHIFPTMSGAYTKNVHELLKSKYPDTYQCMPKWVAMKKLYSTARIYKNAKTLMHPKTGETYPTL